MQCERSQYTDLKQHPKKDQSGKDRIHQSAYQGWGSR